MDEIAAEVNAAATDGDPAPRRAELRPVTGPSAFKGEGRRFMEILWVTAAMRFKVVYRGTALGYFWSLLRPLLLFAVLYVVFSRVVRFGGAVPHYASLLLFNIMIFSFFTDATNEGISSLVSQVPVIRKLHFPRATVTLSVVLTGIFTLLPKLIVIVGFFIYSGVPFELTWLLVPLLLIPFVVMTCGLAMLLAALFVRYRDVGQIWGVLTRALFYASPIFYPAEFVPGNLKAFLSVNPIAPFLIEARHLIFKGPTVQDVLGTSGMLVASTIFLGLVIGGVAAFVRIAPHAAE